MSIHDPAGNNETAVPTDVDPIATVVTCPDVNTRIVVRRIRGSASAEFDLMDGDSDILETVPVGTVDTPGLELKCGWGNNLRALRSSVNDHGAIKVQWNFERRPGRPIGG